MSSNLLKWLYPGMQIKRWVFISLLGICIVALGAYFAAYPHSFVSSFGVIIVLCGIMFTAMGIGKMTISLITLFLPKREQDLVNILYQKRFLERGPKIVAIGGGHGLSNLLLALKEYTANITAIVTVADSGGSSGRLREQFDIVAPGDIRNCLVALADAPGIMGDLFQYRFPEKSELKGHNFGNLFLTALYEVGNRDFRQAVELTSKVLAIRGKVVPSTVSNVHLVARYRDGKQTQGEARIPRSGVPIEKVFLNPSDAAPTEEAIEASSAFKIYVCNVMTQQGETEMYTASEHVKALVEHTHRNIIDAVIINGSEVGDDEALLRYRKENSVPVKADVEELRAMGYKVFVEDIVGVNDYVRHDSHKLTKALISAIERNRVIRR